MLSMAHQSVCALIFMQFYNQGISLMRSKSVLLFSYHTDGWRCFTNQKFVITF